MTSRNTDLSSWNTLYSSRHKSPVFPDYLSFCVFSGCLFSFSGYGLDDRGVGVRMPVGARIFSSPHRPDLLWGSPNLLSNGYSHRCESLKSRRRVLCSNSCNDWGHAVEWLVEVPCFKPDNRGFDSRWGYCSFHLTWSFQPHYGPGVDSASNRNEYQEYSWR
jgi:hypothetical protein